jgi:hypothetical protein
MPRLDLREQGREFCAPHARIAGFVKRIYDDDGTASARLGKGLESV